MNPGERLPPLAAFQVSRRARAGDVKTASGVSSVVCQKSCNMAKLSNRSKRLRRRVVSSGAPGLVSDEITQSKQEKAYVPKPSLANYCRDGNRVEISRTDLQPL